MLTACSGCSHMMRLRERPSVLLCVEFTLEIHSSVSTFTALPPSWEVLRRFVDLYWLQRLERTPQLIARPFDGTEIRTAAENGNTRHRLYGDSAVSKSSFIDEVKTLLVNQGALIVNVIRGIWKFRNIHLCNANAMQQNQVYI